MWHRNHTSFDFLRAMPYVSLYIGGTYGVVESISQDQLVVAGKQLWNENQTIVIGSKSPAAYITSFRAISKPVHNAV
jgi:hypothetical protein